MRCRDLAFLTILGVGTAFGYANDSNKLSNEELFKLNGKANYSSLKDCNDISSFKQLSSALEKYYFYLKDPNLSEQILRVEKFTAGLGLLGAKSSIYNLTDSNDSDWESVRKLALELKGLCPDLASNKVSFVEQYADPNLITKIRNSSLFTENKGKPNKGEGSLIFHNIPEYSKIHEYFGKEPLPIEFEKSFNFGINLKARITGKLDFGNYKGNVVLVNFFTEWCEPCKREMPGLQKIFEKYNGKVNVIGICCEPSSDDYEGLEKLIKEKKITYPIITLSKSSEEIYKVKAWPQSFLIGKEGKVIRGRTSIEEELKK